MGDSKVPTEQISGTKKERIITMLPQLFEVIFREVIGNFTLYQTKE